MTAEPPLLNPFPFAAETHFRLGILLLVASAVALTAGFHTMGAFALSLVAVEDCLLIRLMPILQTFDFAQAETGLYLGLVKAVDERVETCLEPLIGGTITFWSTVLLVCFLAGTAGLAAGHQTWTSWRAGLVPVPEPLHTQIMERIDRLSALIGNERQPALRWAPLETRERTFVFGSDRRPVLALSNGAIVAGLSDPGRFDGLLSHELAHVANRDITTTLMTRAAVTTLLAVIWPLYLLLALAVPNEPESLRHALGGDVASMRVTAWQTTRLALITGVVLIAANAVYRARERFADLRASLVPAVRDDLRQTFGEMVAPPAWRTALSQHPPASQRIQGLRNNRDLFAASLATPFAFTFAVSYATPMVLLMWMSSGLVRGHLVGAIADGSLLLTAVLVVFPVTVLAVPLGAAMAPIAWRAWHASALVGGRRAGAAGPALAAALGTLAGLGASGAGVGFYFSLPKLDGTPGAGLAVSGLVGLVILALQFGLYWTYLLWLRSAAFCWTPVLVRLDRGPVVLRRLLACSALPLVLLIPPSLMLNLTVLFMADIAAAQGQDLGTVVPALLLGAVGSVLFNPLAPVALPIIALLPLAARFARGGEVAGWPVLDGRLQDVPERPILRPLAAATLGAAWGAIVLWLTMEGIWQPALPSDGLLVLATLAVLLALIAAPLAVGTARLRVEHGLVAVLAAALVCSVGLALFGVGIEVFGHWILLSGAMLAGLVTGMVGAGVRALGAGIARVLGAAPRAARS